MSKVVICDICGMQICPKEIRIKYKDGDDKIKMDMHHSCFRELKFELRLKIKDKESVK